MCGEVWDTMPSIKDAIKEGPLTGAERAILRVIDLNPGWTWTDSLEDLGELARFAVDPAAGRPLPTVKPELAQPLSIDDVITVDTRRSSLFPPRPKRTLTLRTVKSALYGLAVADRIWTYRLHGQFHWASHKDRKYMDTRIRKKIERLPAEDRKQVNFRSLTAQEFADHLDGST